ncbi:Surface antigen [Kaistia soli DSM 19436]|uniref:17 kDa surface antigen n=1 Tax=Kaistia soli DSM 19436 TaxID=1122133 RepID=A0A1M5A9B9_9HYPH|nr:glycine zipper 2TM domain-containing protein [Kaistia soli]SHF26888.1 Surface antigen [Kaistia soli DSM 19436]
MQRPALLVTLLSALALSACQAPSNQQLGAIAGSAVGAMIGSQFGSGAGKLGATIVGGGLGGIIGSQIGKSMDQNAQRQASAAETKAITTGQPGVPVSWNAGSSHGQVIPGPISKQNGRDCRPYTHQVVVNGQGQALRGTACQMPDGSWQPVS